MSTGILPLECIAADDGSVQYLAAPVDPAELAAATLAHQASLDMSGLKDAQPRQVLSGRDAGSLNQRGAPLNGSSHSQTAAAVRPAAQSLLVHAAGLAQQTGPSLSLPWRASIQVLLSCPAGSSSLHIVVCVVYSSVGKVVMPC